jgi:hypothetical protein
MNDHILNGGFLNYYLCYAGEWSTLYVSEIWINTVINDDKTFDICSGTNKKGLICDYLDKWHNVNWKAD